VTGDWKRWLTVLGGALLLAGGLCIHMANLNRPGVITGSRPTPLGKCFAYHFPADFLIVVAVLTWITRNRPGSRK